MSGNSDGPFALTLSWIPVPPVDLNGLLKYYEIDITDVETGHNVQSTTLSTSKSIDMLHPYYEYNCRVAAVTIRRGPYTQYIRVRTDESGEQFKVYN